MARARSKGSTNSSADLGFEAKLWLAADKLRSNMDAGEYKHVVLGLIFLKYISDTFEGHYATLLAGKGDYAGADPEDPDEYKALNVFWVPPAARWTYLQNSAKQATIGKIVDDATVAIERDNQRLKGVLPKDYARPALDKHRLGELIDLIGSISFQPSPDASRHPLPVGEGRGEGRRKAVDILGRVYEYFLGMFASAEGKKGGQFYTPQSVVRLLVEMLAPYKGRIDDPCCGSGGMFVQSEKFVEAHGGKIGDISIYGQESNPTTRRLAVMNLALRGIEADFGPRARRHLPPRPPSRPPRRLRPRQSALQRLRLVPQRRRRALAVRRPAPGQRQLRLAPKAFGVHPPPRAPRHGRLRPSSVSLNNDHEA